MTTPCVRLGDLIEEARPGFASGNRDTGGVLQLRMGAVTSTGVVDWTKAVRVPAPPDVSRYLLGPGDVVFNNTNSQELVGRASLVGEAPEPATFSNHITRLRCGDLLDAGYLVSWLNSRWITGFFFEFAHRWVGQSAIQVTRLLDLEIPLPPLDAQRWIAARLRGQLAEAAVLSATIGARDAELAGVLQHAIDSAIATDHTVALAHLLRAPLRTGLSRAASPDARHRVLTLAAVRNGALDLTQTRPMEADAAEAASNAVRAHAFYVVRGNGSLRMAGAGALAPNEVPTDVLYPDLLIQVLPDLQMLSPEYLSLAWRTQFVRRQVQARLRTSAGIHKINLANLSLIGVPLPPFDEQRRITARLQAQLAEIDEARIALDAQRAACDALSAALLREAFEPATPA